VTKSLDSRDNGLRLPPQVGVWIDRGEKLLKTTIVCTEVSVDEVLKRVWDFALLNLYRKYQPPVSAYRPMDGEA
jgi:hypothetical protein